MSYPWLGGDRKGRTRKKDRAAEVHAFGDPDKRLGPPQDLPERGGRIMHGRRIQDGTRPYLKLDAQDERWGGLTARQRKTGRVKTARSWGRMLKAMDAGDMTMEEFIETLSPEELVEGRLRDERGGFTGRPPSWVPREFHRACIRELMRRGQNLYRQNYLQAIQAMTDIATGSAKVGTLATPSERIKAAQFVIERLEGKVPDKIEVSVEAPWQLAIEDIVADVPEDTLLRVHAARTRALTAADQEVVIEAELVEDEPVPVPRRSRRPRRPGQDRIVP